MPTLLGSLARGAFLRQCAFRQRRHGRPEAWGGSGGSSPPSHAHAHQSTEIQRTAGRPQGRRCASTAHGGGGGAPALGDTKALPQVRNQGENYERQGRQRRSQRGEGVVIAGLMQTATRCRCSRRRPGLCSVPASSSRRGRPLLARRLVRRPPSTVDPSSGAPATVRRAAPPLFPPPVPCLPCGGAHRNGENPKVGWWEATATPGASYRITVKATQG
jgi:hypothetical protein